IGYHRDSYRDREDPELRITVDRDIRWREENPDLRSGRGGDLLLPENMRIIELKVQGAMPLWLARALDENRIRPATFSKYGNAFRRNTQPELFALLEGGFLPYDAL
ncbi:MAG: VTC domain-containing protein, partial [Clostridia bacterium]|nr:VTC domain-containing protein [Clostridia bacterium]